MTTAGGAQSVRDLCASKYDGNRLILSRQAAREHGGISIIAVFRQYLTDCMPYGMIVHWVFSTLLMRVLILMW